MASQQDIFAKFIQDLSTKYGVSDPNKLFGGSTGLVATDWSKTPWTGEYERTVKEMFPDVDFSKNLYGGRQPEGQISFSDPAWTTDMWAMNPGQQASPWEWSASDTGPSIDPNQQAFLDKYATDVLPIKQQLMEKYKPFENYYQVSPELLWKSAEYAMNPAGYKGTAIPSIDNLTYDPQYGLTLEHQRPNQPGWNDGVVTIQDTDQGSEFNLFLDELKGAWDTVGPVVMMALGGYGLGQLGAGAEAAGAGLGEAGAAAGEVGAAGEGLSSSIYSLGSGGGSLGFDASGFLGGASNLGGIGGSGLGFAGTAANTAGWGGFAPYAAGVAGGTLGGAIDYGLGSGPGNLGFDASGAFGGTPSLGGTAGGSLGIGTPGNAGWWGAGTGLPAPTVGSLSMLDQAKAAYDKYVKPLNQTRSVINTLTSDNSGDGLQYPTQGPTQEPDYGIAPTTYYPPVNYQNYGIGGGPLQNMGGTPQLPNIGDGISGYFDYLPDYIKKGVIQRRSQ